ncbi:MAG TPA: hypothetical protein VLF14_02035 [Candidatus Binatia bacterium]|nr:hypothetical protein [Candidatus Binatia bacterium]
MLLGMVGDRIGITSALRWGGFAIVGIVALVMLRSPAIFQPVEQPIRP